MYEIGFMLPIIIIVGFIIFLVKEGSEQAKNDREIDKLIEENARITREYFNELSKNDTIE